MRNPRSSKTSAPAILNTPRGRYTKNMAPSEGFEARDNLCCNIFLESGNHDFNSFDYTVFRFLIIIDIYPGSFTHPKVAFRKVLHKIELEFGNVDF